MIHYSRFLTILGHFGPICTLLDHFRQNLILCAKSRCGQEAFYVFEALFVFDPSCLAFLPLSCYFCFIQATIYLDNLFFKFLSLLLTFCLTTDDYFDSFLQTQLHFTIFGQFGISSSRLNICKKNYARAVFEARKFRQIMRILRHFLICNKSV